MMNSKFIKYVFIVLLTLIFGTLYLIADSKLYYYGESTVNICKKSLPFGVSPKVWSCRDFFCGFLILTDRGRLLAGNKVSYELHDGSIETKEIIKYGFNENKLIVFIEDVNNDHYYIEISKCTDTELRKDFKENVLEQESIINATDYKWIEIKKDEGKTSDLVAIKGFCILLFVIVVPTILLGSFILSKARKA